MDKAGVFPSVYGNRSADFTIGTNYIEVGPHKVVAELEVVPELTQPAGLLHGGINVVLAESVCSVAANVYNMHMLKITNPLECPTFMVGMEINANHLASLVVGDVAVATATPVHRGKQSQVWNMEIRRKSDGVLSCISRCTMHATKNPAYQGKKASPKL